MVITKVSQTARINRADKSVIALLKGQLEIIITKNALLQKSARSSFS